jgi:hypothetical protein
MAATRERRSRSIGFMVVIVPVVIGNMCIIAS